jgi:hypothetical protein
MRAGSRTACVVALTSNFVSTMLSAIRVDSMSLDPDPETDARAARAIVDWYAMRVDG